MIKNLHPLYHGLLFFVIEFARKNLDEVHNAQDERDKAEHDGN